MDKRFKTAVLGGTFDHLHKGHKEFILFALSLSEKLIIGLTSDEYISKAKVGVESFEKRKKELQDFIEEKESEDRIKIVEIDDEYGIAISHEFKLDALIAVDKTQEGTRRVNEKRESLGITPLTIIIAPSTYSEDRKVISSSRIRSGEIDREGKLYVRQEWLEKDLLLPQDLRGQLKKPWGDVVTSLEKESLPENIATVGDITTKKLNELGKKIKLAVVDFNVGRQHEFDSIEDLNFPNDAKLVEVENKPGEISTQLFSAVVNTFSSSDNTIIKIDGEDDLAVLPIILASPLDLNIFYGQPNVGLVKIIVSEKIKDLARNILGGFNLR